MNRILLFLLLCGCLLAGGCKRGFESIEYGKEACAHCRMTILDPRFAAELIDAKGKVYKFDDVACMKKFMQEQGLSGNKLLLYVADYAQGGKQMLDAAAASYVRSENYASPMNGNAAAFSNREAARRQAPDKEAKVIDWPQL